MGGAIGLPLDVEICGTTWSSPIVREPLVTGSLMIPVPDQTIAEELEQYLTGAVECRP